MFFTPQARRKDLAHRPEVPPHTHTHTHTHTAPPSRNSVGFGSVTHEHPVLNDRKLLQFLLTLFRGIERERETKSTLNLTYATVARNYSIIDTTFWIYSAQCEVVLLLHASLTTANSPTDGLLCTFNILRPGQMVLPTQAKLQNQNFASVGGQMIPPKSSQLARNL